MFEQKASAFVASFSAQIAAAGVLILVPLLYHDVLPEVKLPTFLPFTLAPHVPVAEQRSEKTASSSTRPSFTAGPYRLPTLTFARSSGAPAPEGAYIDAPPLAVAGSSTEAVAPLISQSRSLPPPPPPVVAEKVQSKPIQQMHVGGDIQAAKILTRVIPAYPAMARQARISGTVRLLGVIAKDGTVQKLQVLSGHPYLVRAAVDAVRQWVYRPTVLDGEPVEVIAPIDVIFTLAP
jgi:protein TonB